jgi:hypothetical protein
MMTTIWLLAGVFLGALWIAWVSRHKRGGRQVLAIGLLLAAAVYVAFAFGADSVGWVVLESIGLLAFGCLGWLGIRGNVVWLAAGWGLHPLWDVGLHWHGPGAAVVPDWYAVACVSFDLVVAIYILYTLAQPARSRSL